MQPWKGGLPERSEKLTIKVTSYYVNATFSLNLGNEVYLSARKN